VRTSGRSINDTPLGNDCTDMAAVNDGIICLHSYDTPNVSKAARRLELNRSILGKHFSGRTGHQVKADEDQ
jgi:hypothetical protein